MHTGFLWGNLKERDHLEEVDIDGGDDIEMALKDAGWEFHKMQATED